MKKYSILSIIFLLSFMVLFAGCGNKENDTAVNTAGNTERTAKVISVSGKAIVTKSDGKALPAFNGMSMNQGDKIKTEGNSTMVLEIGEGKQLKISENTEFAMSLLQISKDSQVENTRIELGEGVVWINIKNKLNPGSEFEIETPTAVMGVRGTIFSVLHSGDASKLAVIDGSVTAAKTIEIKNSDGSTTKKVVATVVGKNKIVEIDDSIQSQEDFDIQLVAPESLDPFTLENVKELLKTQPGSVDNTLKEELEEQNEDTNNREIEDEQNQAYNQDENEAESETEENGKGDNKREMVMPDIGSIGALLGSGAGEKKLPDGYPGNVMPIIAGAEVIFGYNEGDHLIVVLDVSKGYQSVKDYYTGIMNGAEDFFQQEIEGMSIVGGTKAGYDIGIIVTPQNVFDQKGIGVIISMVPST